MISSYQIGIKKQSHFRKLMIPGNFNEASSFSMQLLKTSSKETVLDMTYDWKGDRMAVATADRKITIYKKNEDKTWVVNSEFSDHYGPIWKIKWAHEFLGNVIATCKTVSV